MEKQYTNFSKNEFTSIDEINSEADILLRIIGGYLYKYKIFNEEDKQDIVGSIFIEIDKRISSKPISSGYIHCIIRNNILLFLRPVVKEVKYQLEETNDFAKDYSNDNDSSTEDNYRMLDLVTKICPPTHLEYIESILEGKTKTELGTTKYNKLRLYREDIRAVVRLYKSLKIMAKNEDLIPNFAKEHKISKSVLKEFVVNYKLENKC